MKIYQIYYDEHSKSLIDNTFIPFDNSIPDKPNEFEYGVMRKLHNTEYNYLGVMSWKFKQKTEVDPKDFTLWIEQNEGYDLYTINPFYKHSKYFRNVWHQGEMCHPGIIKLVTYLFDKAGIETSMLSIPHEPKLTCFCNYWVANKRFWDQYIHYTEKLYKAVYESDKEVQNILFHIQADIKIKSGMFSFIFERMFTTILAKHQNEFKVLNYFN